MPSLVERLNNLGLQKASQVKPSNRELKRPLEDILGARVVENSLGRVLIVEKVFPFGYKHGDIEFVKEVDTDSIHQAGKLNSQTENIEKLVFLDTETTGLSGGTGTIAFLVGLAWFQNDGLKLAQLIIDDPAEEPAMLLELSNISETKEAVVSFNGKSFDMPLLKTRYVMNRMPVPFSDWGHLDLLHLSRRLWRNRLESRTLKDLETEILHIPRTDEEVPGWMIPEIYFNYLRTGDGSKLSNVVYHNAMDIVSLAALYLSISNILDRDLFSESTNIEDVYAIGKIYQDIGELNKTRSIFEHCLSKTDLDHSIKNDIQSRLALMHKKEKDWEKAILLWQDNGNSGDIDACIEMAKYFEHEILDVESALEWTLKAENNLEKSSLLRYKKKTIKSALLVRKNRLEKRINHV